MKLIYLNLSVFFTLSVLYVELSEGLRESKSNQSEKNVYLTGNLCREMAEENETF